MGGGWGGGADYKTHFLWMMFMINLMFSTVLYQRFRIAGCRRAHPPSLIKPAWTQQLERIFCSADELLSNNSAYLSMGWNEGQGRSRYRKWKSRSNQGSLQRPARFYLLSPSTRHTNRRREGLWMSTVHAMPVPEHVRTSNPAFAECLVRPLGLITAKSSLTTLSLYIR